MTGSRVTLTVEGAVANIVIDHPQRKNALNGQGWGDLAAVLEQVSVDSSVRVVTLSGTGGDLCSGMDLEEPEESAHPVDAMRILNRVAQRLYDMPKPVVTRVDGVAVGAGLSMVLASDFVFATPESRFSAIFARRGLSLDCGASWGLTRQSGLLAAKRVAMLGEMLSADEAMELGWITWLRSAEQTAEEHDALVNRLLTMSPRALAESKSLLNHAASSTLPEALAMEALAQTVNLGTDAPEAFESFVNRREPDFTGTWRMP